MKNPFNRFHLVTLAAALSAGLVHATPIYSTLGPGNSFDTNSSVRFDTTIGTLPDAYGDEFTSPVTATVGSVSLALGGTLIASGMSVIVAIHSNTPSGPGGILGSATQIVLTRPRIYTFDFSTGIHLVAGTEYWLSAAAPVPSGGADWFLNNQGVDNNIASRKTGVWTVDGPGTALAFSLNPVPEPGSAALSTMAIAYLWRKRSVSIRT